MKVLHTLDSFGRGGTETLVLDVCRNAQRFGVDLTFVATGGGILEQEFKESGVEFIRLQRDLPFDLNLIWKLRKIIKESGIKILHGYQPVEVLHLYIASLGLSGVKVVQSHQGYIEGRKNILTSKFISPLIDANISCSRGLFPWIRKEIGLDTSKNFYLIHNGIDEDRVKPSGKDFRAELGFSKDSLLLGMVANFRPDKTKDQMTVCRALPKVFKKFENANFIFVGKVSDGGEENFDACIDFCNKSGIGDRVFFLGGRDDVPDILDALDLFVFSSLKEGLPLAVVEAMFAGVPTIVSDIPPLLEIADGGKNAEIFQIKSDAELSKKIIKVLKSDKLKDDLTQNAYKFADGNFSMQAHFRGLLTLYKSLLISADKKETPSDLSNKDKADSIFGLD